MNISRSERKELDALSLELLGASTRWQKLVNKGYQELVTEKKTETVPGENGEPDTTKEVDAPVLRSDGAHQYVIKRHTVESIKTELLSAKTRLEEFKAAYAKQQEEAKAKKEAEDNAKRLQDEAGGSAL